MRLVPLCLPLLLGACAALVPTDHAVQNQAGLTVQKEQRQYQGGTRVRVSGASWLQGGDASALFQREAAAAAQALGCCDYRVEGRRESQEQTLLGNRRVVEGTVMCSGSSAR